MNIRPDTDESSEAITTEYHDSGEAILAMSRDPHIYQQLTRSICPAVFGHDSIKQAVLLMLFGGVHKKTYEVHLREGMSERESFGLLVTQEANGMQLVVHLGACSSGNSRDVSTCKLQASGCS